MNQNHSNSHQDKHDELFKRAKAVSPGGVHSPVRSFRGVGGTPLFIQAAQGAELIDVGGRRYVDYCQSWGPLIFGHGDPEVREAVQSALGRGWSFGAAEPYSLELAELMTTNIKGLDRVRFVNSGTEAVMSALRVARAATNRDYILKFDGCYHGHVDSMLVKAGSGLAEMAAPDSAGVSRATAAETIVAPLDDEKALAAIMSERGSTIAAIIVEPIPANNGLLLPRVEWLRSVAEQAKKYGALLIFDEVITGFRVAFGGMVERLGREESIVAAGGIVPDLMTYGKIIGGGFPVGAYGGRADLMDLVAPAGPVYQAGTLSANPVAMVAGTTMLKKLLREAPYEALEARTTAMARALEAKTGGAVQVQTIASLFWPTFKAVGSPLVRHADAFPAGQKEKYATVFHKLLGRGIYLPPSGVEVGFLSTAHTNAHLEQLVEEFSEEFLKTLP
jgi:glutamate-1-semialdehyde 2,1-aminomutase